MLLLVLKPSSLELKMWTWDRQQGPPVGTGAVAGLLGNRRPLSTNDQSHLELPGLKSTFLSFRGRIWGRIWESLENINRQSLSGDS